MKKLVASLLTLAIIFTLGGCSSTESSPPAASSSRVETDPKVLAESTDATIYAAVKGGETVMNQLKEYFSGFGSTYTSDDIVAYCKSETSTIEDYRTQLREVPEQEKSEEYRAAADDFLLNIEAALICMKDFIEDGDTEKGEHAVGCFEMYNNYVLSYTAARYDYLADAGFTTEEITAITEGENE